MVIRLSSPSGQRRTCRADLLFRRLVHFSADGSGLAK